MSNCELELTLDHSASVYHFGEDVTGTIEARVASPRKWARLAVEWEWRTHGWGNSDSGKTNTLKLFEGYWERGQTYSYPFRFTAPSGPETYHGYYLNVDWYLRARADIPGEGGSDVESEFLLIAPESQRGGDFGADVRSLNGSSTPSLGSTYTSPQPVEDEINPGIFRLVAAVLLLILGLLSLMDYALPHWSILGGNIEYLGCSAYLSLAFILVSLLIYWFVVADHKPSTLLTPVALLIGMGLGLLGVAILPNWLGPLVLRLDGGAVTLIALYGIYQGVGYRRFRRITICVQPVVVRRGGTIKCLIRVPESSERALTHAVATLSGRECAEKVEGSLRKNHEYVVCNKELPFVRRFGQSDDKIAMEALLSISDDAPVTFSGYCNQLSWSVGIRLGTRGFPQWSCLYPVTVCP